MSSDKQQQVGLTLSRAEATALAASFFASTRSTPWEQRSTTLVQLLQAVYQNGVTDTRQSLQTALDNLTAPR